jgi:WD40 repeat protein
MRVTKKYVNLFFLFFCLGVCFSRQTAIAQEYKTQYTFQGHFGAVQNLRFSPDGQILASGGFDGYIILWNIKTGKSIRAIKSHRATVTEVTFSKEGKYIASSSQDGSANVFETETGKKVASFLNRPFIITDSKTKNGVVVTDTVFQNGVSFVTFSPDSKYVYFAGDNGYVMKGDLTTGKSQSIASTNYSDSQWYSNITGGTITADGKYLVLTVGHHVKYLDLKTEKFTQEIFYADADLNDVVTVPNKNQIAVWSYEGKVTIWDNKSKSPIKSYLVSEPDNYSAASFNKDGTELLTSASGNEAKIWNTQTGKFIRSLGGHSKIVRLSRFSPNEDIIATGSYDGTIRIWHKEELEPVTLLATNTQKSDKEVVIVKKTDKQTKPELIKTETKDTKNITTVTPEPVKDTQLKFNNEVVEVGKVIQLQAIEFEQSNYVLLKSSYSTLDKLVDFLQVNPQIVIELSGHTDNRGDEKKNYTLSERRVATVISYLVSKKIDEKRIIAKAYGGTQPIADNESDFGRQKNRRVEMRFIKM